MENRQRDEGRDDAGVDYIFEIPLQVAQSIVEFKDDEDHTHVIDNAFEVLSRKNR